MQITRSYVFLPCAYRSFSVVNQVWSEPLTTEEKQKWNLETLEQLQKEETLELVENGLLNVFTVANNECCWVKTVVNETKGPFWPLFGQWFSAKCFAPCTFLHLPQKITTVNDYGALLYAKPTLGTYKEVKNSLPLDSLDFRAVLYQLILAVHSLHISGFVHQSIDETAILLSSDTFVMQLGNLGKCTQRPARLQDTETQEWKHDAAAVAALLWSKARDGTEWGDQGAEQVWAQLSGKTDPSPDRAILAALPLPYFDAVRRSSAPWHTVLVSQTPPIVQASKEWKSINTWTLHQTWLLHQAETPSVIPLNMLDYHNSPGLYNLWESLLGSFDKVQDRIEDVPVEDFCQAFALGFQLILYLKDSVAVDFTLVTSLNCATQNKPFMFKEDPKILMEVATSTQMEASQWMPVTAFRILALEYRLRRKQRLPVEAEFMFALLAQHPAFHLLDQRFVARLVQSWLTKSLKDAVAEASHDFPSVDSETKTCLEKILTTLLADKRANDLASETASNGRSAFRRNTAHQEDIKARFPVATLPASQLHCPSPPDEKQVNALVQSLLPDQDTKDAEQKCLDLTTQLLSREARREKLFASKLPADIEGKLLSDPGFFGGQGLFLVFKDEDKEKKYILKSGKSIPHLYSLYKEWFISRHVPPSIFLLSPLFFTQVSSDHPPSPPTANIFSILPRACKDLLTHMVQKALTPFAYRFLIYQLILAIHCMQMAGVVHRDLKYENVFIVYEHNQDEFLVQISDYGLARYWPALSDTQVMWQGTRSYSLMCLKDCDQKFFSNWIWRQDHLFLAILLYNSGHGLTRNILGFPGSKDFDEGDLWTENVIPHLSYRGWPSFRDGRTRQLWDHLMNVDPVTNQERNILSALTLPYFDEVRKRNSPLVKFVIDQTPPILTALPKHMSSLSVWRVHQTWLQEQAELRGRELHQHVIDLATRAQSSIWILQRWVALFDAEKYLDLHIPTEQWCEFHALAFELVLRSENKYEVSFDTVFNLMCSTQSQCDEEHRISPPSLSLLECARQERNLLPVTAFRLLAVDYRLRTYKNNNSQSLVPADKLQSLMTELVKRPFFHALDQRFVAQFVQQTSEKDYEQALEACILSFPTYKAHKEAILTWLRYAKLI